MDAVTRFKQILACTDKLRDDGPIAAIEKEIVRRTEQLRQLQVLRRKKLSLRSPFCRLPSELMAEIFSHYLQVGEVEGSKKDFRRNPLFLGKICAAWREIVWSTPRLWSSVDLVISDALSQTEVLRDWLMRSGDCQLSITVAKGRSVLASAAIDVIVAHSGRWRVVGFSLPWQDLRDMSPHDLSNLTSVSIDSDRYPQLRPDDSVSNRISAFFIAPRLRTVSLFGGVSPFMVKLPWDQLTTFHGITCNIGELCEVLRQAKNIKNCVFEFPNTFRERRGFNNTPAVTLLHEHLRSLVLRTMPSISSDPLQPVMDRLTLPSLRSLEITGSNYRFRATAVINMLSRSSVSLQRLYTRGMILTEVELLRCLRAMPSLVELRADYIKSAKDIGRERSSQQVAYMINLPRLTTITLHYMGVSDLGYILDSITLPAAHRIEIKGEGRSFPYRQFRELLTRSCCSLHSFTLRNVRISKFQLLQCLFLVPSIVELKLANLSWPPGPEFDLTESLTTEILTMLCCYQTNSVSVLPNLEVIQYLGAVPYDAGVLCDMLESRWKAPAEGGNKKDGVAQLRTATVRLRSRAGPQNDHVPDTDRLRRLEEEGMQLSIGSFDASSFKNP